MNAWFFYIIGFIVVLISRVSVSYTSIVGAFISMAGIIILLQNVDYNIKGKAKYFNFPIYFMLLCAISILGIFHEKTTTTQEFLSLFIHICVALIVCILVCVAKGKEDELIENKILKYF